MAARVGVAGLDQIGGLAARAMESLEDVEAESASSSASIGAVGIVVEVTVEDEGSDRECFIWVECNEDRPWVQKGLFEAARDVLAVYQSIDLR